MPSTPLVKSGRRELNHWQLTYGDLSPIQLHLPDAIRNALGNRVLLRHVPTLGFDHELELVRLEQRSILRTIVSGVNTRPVPLHVGQASVED